MRKFPKLPIVRASMTTPKAVAFESVIPDQAAYAKYPVQSTDDQEKLVRLYQAAQVDCLRRLTGQAKPDLHDPKVQRQIHEHNKKMRLYDQTA